MAPDLYWIPLDAPGRLAITARPRGNDWLADEVAGWKRAGIGTVVSLLEPDEAAELGLADEATETANQGIRLIPLPMPDRAVPPDQTVVDAVVAELVQELTDGGRVAVHCRQGIGRSALLAIVVLKELGMTTDEAIRRVSAARGRPVPETSEQVEWIARYNPAVPAGSGTSPESRRDDRS
jgi:protein-tyrosine phosphatase